MGVSEKTRKIVWAEAGGRCAICRGEVITPGTDCDDPSVFGEEAHIVARSKGGPRAEDLDDASRDSHTNLLLLCSRHHKQIDDQPTHFTVERLREIKERHAAWVRRSLDDNTSGGVRLVPDPAFPQPRALALITRGNPLWNMIKASLAFEYALPDDLPDDEESLIVEFLDLLRDYLDIAPELHSVRDNRDAEKTLEGYVRELAEQDFLVGAYVRHLIYVDGRGDPLAWPMLRVEVLPTSVAVVTDQAGRPYTTEQGEEQPAER
ncbi:HNH endonuclease [Streptomyces sp. 372A]|uniref:HNH endonuclease n=1 Tax=unclassified Streptomyces TaxID=2593676 RepID=UPI0020352889|nr:MULTISPECIES: HNH endonuclease signature motif containing protein [unclassified Streptomyces]MCX4725436.1 HNH endonuclease [Streptomyces sp. NBC_01306]